MSDFKNFPTCHCHPQSLDSGSTVEAIAKREVELGTGAIVMTDHGTMGAGRAVYDAAKKHKLTPVLGLEGFFRDDNCPILLGAGVQKDEKGTLASYLKYFHITLHSLDQSAYEAMVRILSRADLQRGEQHGSERKPIFNWQDLEELGAHNITVGSGCLVGMVQRHLLGDTPRPDLALAYYERLRGIFKPGNMYVEVFPHRCDKYWEKAVFLEFGTTEGVKLPDRKLWFGKKLRVSIGDEVVELAAFELADKFDKWNGRVGPPVKLLAVNNRQNWTEEPLSPPILFAKAVEDYLSNECTPFSPNGDIQESANKFVLGLAAKYKDPILISDDAHFARPEDRVVQDVRLLSGEQNKTKGAAPAFRFYGSYHRYTSVEAFDYFNKVLGVPERVFEKWVDNACQWRDRFGWKFKDRKQLPDKFYPKDTMRHLMSLIKETGRMDWTNKAWVERLTAEVKLMRDNGTIDFLPYFFLAQEGIRHYENEGHLPGPGRGSAAGMLLAYMLGITHVEPLRYGLSKERFMTATRIASGKFPDIDMDFGKSSRSILIDPDKGWLKRRFGDHCAQISTDTMLRLKSSIQDVHRMLDGEVPPAVWGLTSNMETPKGVDDFKFVFGYRDADGNPVQGSIETDTYLKEYVAKYPQHWEIVVRALGVVKGKGRHASAFVVTNEPTSNFIPLTMVGGVPCTSYNMKGVEAAGGIKMDYLGINTLDDIEGAIKWIQKRAGWTPQTIVIDGKQVPAMRVIPKLDQDGNWRYYDVWDLPDDQAVFNDITGGKANKSIFQFGTPAAQKWLQEFVQNDGTSSIKSIEDLSAFTALDRPGGLDSFVDTVGGGRRNMLQEFAARSKGQQACVGRLAILDELFPETYGVLCYQEQLQKAFVELGGTSPEEGDEFRVHVSKKRKEKVMQDKSVFMRGAVARLGQADADRLWGMLETFANYGFNKSHAICYTVVGYACAWLQHHFNLEWWASVLSNAEREEIDGLFWRHAGHLIDPPDIQLSGDGFDIQNDRIRAPLSLLVGIGPAAHAELVAGRPYKDIRDFAERIKAKKSEIGENGKKKRSAINSTMITKMIVAGCADSLFPSDKRPNVFAKLSYFEEVDADVNNRRYKRSGELKLKPIDQRFLNLTPMQRFLLTKSILPSFTADLGGMLGDLGRTDLRVSNGRYAWHAPDAFEGQNWTMLVSGPGVKGVFDGTIRGLPPKFKFGCIAYISGSESFWGGKAQKLSIDVDGERFEVNQWPKNRWVTGVKKRIPCKLPDGAVGGVCVVTFSRWDLAKEFTVDDVCLITPAFALKIEESSS